MKEIIKKKDLRGCGIPQLHGHTKIILRNPKTGEEKIIEKDNLVTDAVSDIFANNLFGLLDYSLLLPVRDFFGGVLCYETTHDTTILFPARTNKMIANAGQSAHTSASTTRGNPNGGESQELANGFKFVWDFATNQGNGTISALSLCHKWGGDIGYKPIEQIADETLLNVNAVYKLRTAMGNRTARGSFDDQHLCLIYLDSDGEIGYHVSGTKVFKVKVNAKAAGINNVIDSYEILDSWDLENQVTYTAGLTSVTYDILSERILYITINSTTSVTIDFFDPSDDSVETETISGQGLNLDPTYYASASYPNVLDGQSCNRFVTSGQYIFLPEYNGNFYRINLNNTSDIVEITSYMGSVSRDYETLGQISLSDSGIVMGANYLVTNDGVYPISVPDLSLLYVLGTGVTAQVRARRTITTACDASNLMWMWGDTSNAANQAAFYLGIGISTPYLGTIQNLETPVVKTSDRTMKIEYTITNS